MNAKCRAKYRTRLAGALALTAWLIPVSVTADDGNLNQQLHIQQQKSRFQLMLEQVQESARRRAAAAQTAPTRHAGPSTLTHLGDGTQSVRLDPVTVTDPVSPKIDPERTKWFRAQQAYERDQQRILDHRQQRRALIAGARTGGPNGIDRIATKRRALVRYNAQNQRQSLQRKLRR